MTLTIKLLALSILTLFIVTPSLLSCNLVLAEHTDNTWVSKAEAPPSKIGVKATSANGMIYFMGDGINFQYDPKTNSWVEKTPMPTPRNSFAMAVYQNKIFTLGGNLAWTQEDGYIASNSIEVYDPSTDMWETKEPMPVNRSTVGAGIIDGKIHLIGNQTHQVYDIASGTWIDKELIPFHPNSGYGFEHSTTVFDNKIYVIIKNQTQIYDPPK